jgi:hypothetical protein
MTKKMLAQYLMKTLDSDSEGRMQRVWVWGAGADGAFEVRTRSLSRHRLGENGSGTWLNGTRR